MGFLKRDDRFVDEEPYAFRYMAEDMKIPLTNMETEYPEVQVCNLRGQESRAGLDSCGFEIRKLRSHTKYNELPEGLVEDTFKDDVIDQLKEDYGASDADVIRVRVLAHLVAPHSQCD